MNFPAANKLPGKFIASPCLCIHLQRRLLMLLVLTMMGNARSLDKWERATGTGSYAFCFIIVFLPTRGVRRRFIQAHETFLIFSILATVSFLSKINAQTSTATPDHNGELTTFNGSSSFAKAMEAASEGDAIYLSAGHYDATDITKPVSIKGQASSTTRITVSKHL